MISQNQGADWSKLNLGDAVLGLAINPKNDQQIIAYSQGQGLVLSSDGGNSWNRLSNYTGSMVMQLAYDPQNPSVIYLINQNLEIHKTTDGGSVWKKVF
jgi:photosystem II stability/assembly factor-like uncharacterized protein